MKPAIKRTWDICGSLLMLLWVAPVFLAIAALIKLTSPGPVFFRQRRVGPHGSFTLLKFRSMYVNNDATKHKEYVRQLIAGQAEKSSAGDGKEGVFKLTNDPRITPIGRFIRRTDLDKLRQLINVLRGEISLLEGQRERSRQKKRPPGAPPPPPAVPVHSLGDVIRITQSRNHRWPASWTLASDTDLGGREPYESRARQAQPVESEVTTRGS